MSSALTELCKNLQNDTDKLEQELKGNILDCHKLLLDNRATETKLSLEKAKDFHYKEVLDILKNIVSSIKMIIFHENKIKSLNDESNFSPDELKRYSYVQRQVQAFSRGEEGITRREKRRVASEISVDSLEAWEQYLEKKTEEEKVVQVEKVAVPKRNKATSRRKKKFVSSTFNNFLDGSKSVCSLESILEDEHPDLEDRLAEGNSVNDCTERTNFQLMYEDEFESDTSEREFRVTPCSSINSIDESDADDKTFRDDDSQDYYYSASDIPEALDQECSGSSSEDTKPKIVDVIYKKKGQLLIPETRTE